MGKTVESYRIALEGEIDRWNGFSRALRRSDREAYEELMDMCRSFASEGGNATKPVLFEPMVMSMLLGQQVRIRQLERKLQDMQLQKTDTKNPETTSLALNQPMEENPHRES